ncbi:MAG: flagellar hook protein FlgE [Methylotenera sp.]|jgi:flagellar hook protein FlgE|nr:flagellar hook protein FlgE [Methylotenera sp.]
MSFQQGLSGLNAASKQLDVVGNNVANSNTVGFKQARAEFADVYAASLTGAGGTQVGIGVKVAAVAQQFTQGNITSTNNPLDIAINGNGFFRMEQDSVPTYTRNGQFQVNKDGFIVDSGGKFLTGYGVDTNGVIITANPAPLVINTADSPPQVTTAVTGTLNLDSRQSVPALPFDAADPATYNNTSAVTVYDTLGNPYTLQSYFVKGATPGEWVVHSFVNGNNITGGSTPTTPPSYTMTFGATGINPTPTAAQAMSFNTNITVPATAVNLTLDYSSSTQFGSNFSINNLTQDGFASGRLARFSAAADGTIVGSFTNGQSKVLGQIVLTRFNNPNGLQNLGGNAWTETASSGPAQTGAPGQGLNGVLQSSAVEDSNVDLTAELVNMITAQRFYQANAQTIKAQDQVLQTLVNLR